MRMTGYVEFRWELQAGFDQAIKCRDNFTTSQHVVTQLSQILSSYLALESSIVFISSSRVCCCCPHAVACFSICRAFVLLTLININRTFFFLTFFFTLSLSFRVQWAPVTACLSANGPSVLAATRLVAVESTPAMPLIERVLGFNAELTGSQAWPEAADVVERGV